MGSLIHSALQVHLTAQLSTIVGEQWRGNRNVVASFCNAHVDPAGWHQDGRHGSQSRVASAEAP